jgi:hypothetical protein
MATRNVRIVMNGVTGRMGYRQHLLRSVLAIRDDGGITLPDGGRLQVEPVLVGRTPAKLAGIARAHDVADFTTDLDAALADESANRVLRRPGDRRTQEDDPHGDRGGQARLHGETDRQVRGRGPGAGADGRLRRDRQRGRPRQALPAPPAAVNMPRIF